MFDSLLRPNSLYGRQPAVISLDPEQSDPWLAKSITNPGADESERWQLHLNALAVWGFQEWLHRTRRTYQLDRSQGIYRQSVVYKLLLRGLRLNLIVQEHVLDEIVTLPQAAIEQPELAAHFYLPIEVAEEQQQVILHGSLRYDRLMDYCRGVRPINQHYQMPLSMFDLEPNHVLFFSDFLDPASIPLPQIVREKSLANSRAICLSQWLQGWCSTSWQTLDNFFSPNTYPAFQLRHASGNAQRGRLIDLGLELQNHPMVLLVNVTEEHPGNLSVMVQLHPVGTERYLLPDVQLMMLSAAGKRLQEISSRAQDNYIQLRSFKGRPGTAFSIEVSLGNAKICEQFVI